MKIGFDTNGLKSGPKVFMSRLRKELAKQGKFNDKDYDIWLQPTVTSIPSLVLRKKREHKCKIVIRCAGARNIDFTPNFFGRPIHLLDPLINAPLSRYFNRSIINNIYRYDVDHVIYQSHYSKRSVEALLGQTPVANTIVTNGVDLDDFKPSENQTDGRSDSFPKIIMSHYFKPKKRAQQCPRIIHELKKIYPNVKVVLTGSGFGKTMDVIRREIAAHNLQEHFDIVGEAHFDKLHVVYNSCHFMLCLSYDDPCPNVVIEAIACGLPVVYTNTGGVPEIVADAGIGVNENIEINKRYVPHFSYKYMPQIEPDGYVQAIEKLISDYEHYRKQAVIRRSVFSIENVASRYIKVMESL